jgi:hypothetical protein
MRVRPLLVIVAALAATGALRAGLAVQDAPSSLASLDRLFGSLAQASGSPPAPAAAPPAMPAASPAAVVPEEMLRAAMGRRKNASVALRVTDKLIADEEIANAAGD